MTRIPEGTAPSILNKSFEIAAALEIGNSDAEGILATQGGRFNGWGLYLLKGEPLQTKVRGNGKVIVTTRGPIEETSLERGKRVVAEGAYVIARTADVSFKMQRPTKNFFGRFTSGESFVRVYEGPGRILLNPAPYWRYWMLTRRGGNPDNPSQTAF
jgi:uncharacterized protein (AIM24 family)